MLVAVRDAHIRDAKLRDEALRSAKGMCLNIAEGAGRVTRADKARAYTIARGEAVECAAALEIAALLGDASAEERRACASREQRHRDAHATDSLMTNATAIRDPFPFTPPLPSPRPRPRRPDPTRPLPLRFARPEHHTLRIQPRKDLVFHLVRRMLVHQHVHALPPHETTATLAGPVSSTSSSSPACSPPSRAMSSGRTPRTIFSAGGPPEPRAAGLRWRDVFAVLLGDRNQVDARLADLLGYRWRGGLAVDLLGGARLEHTSAREHHDAIAHRERFGLIVGHVDHRGLELAAEADQLDAQRFAQLGVEVGERLVHEKEPGRRTMARPIATRCISPPESLVALRSSRWLILSSDPAHSTRSLMVFSSMFRPGARSGNSMFLRADQSG